MSLSSSGPDAAEDGSLKDGPPCSPFSSGTCTSTVVKWPNPYHGTPIRNSTNARTNARQSCRYRAEWVPTSTTILLIDLVPIVPAYGAC